MTKVAAFPKVKVSLICGKVYPGQFTIPASATVKYKNDSSEEVTDTLRAYPVSSLIKSTNPSYVPFTQPPVDFDTETETPKPNYPSSYEHDSSLDNARHGYCKVSLAWHSC